MSSVDRAADVDCALERQKRDQIERHLRGIINHWNEFGPEHGLDELMSYASSYLASHAANS